MTTTNNPQIDFVITSLDLLNKKLDAVSKKLLEIQKQQDAIMMSKNNNITAKQSSFINKTDYTKNEIYSIIDEKCSKENYYKFLNDSIYPGAGGPLIELL